MQHIAIIGDLKKSRSSTDRASLQEAMILTLSSINQEFSAVIEADIMINSGDSFQGILSTSAPVLLICDKIRFSIKRLSEMRIGIGIGEINTSIQRDLSILADGPAFWHAREALSSIKRQDYYDTHSFHLCLHDNNNPSRTETLVNQVLIAQDQMVSKWKNRQLELARRHIMQHGYMKIPQVELAKELGVIPQQVNTMIQAMGFLAYLDIMSNTQDSLLSILKEMQV